MRRLIRLAAGVYPRTWQDRYGAEFEALIEDLDLSFDSSSGGGGVGEGVKAVVENALSPAALSKVIAKEDLYERECSKTAGTDVAGLMRKSVRIERLPAASGAPVAFSVAFDYAAPAVAQRVVNDLTSGLIEENLRASVSTDRPNMRLQLLDPASLPGQAVRDGREPIALG